MVANNQIQGPFHAQKASLEKAGLEKPNFEKVNHPKAASRVQHSNTGNIFAQVSIGSMADSLNNKFLLKKSFTGGIG